ncbi:Coiled-coil domain-containing protein R3HCC1L [Madurella mycetomatis]|uniref:Coiled-coil domain-containing protein R3HCC1L n=1 Tax=Madurella mycetomatis TaxID=100816 RepID=A0A175W281_9PEZI|nr:Coiled-coil domain-containing protein R3HCC1L [Madurella mycetomatis]
MAPKAADDIASGVTKLSLKTTALDTTAATVPLSKRPKKKTTEVADSWEDEADDDSSSASEVEATPTPVGNSHAGTSAPPPTPMSPVAGRRPFSPSALSGPGFTIPPLDGVNDGSQSATGPSSKRPEKTDAVARRMIASALGMKAPKQTEEQRAYDRAVRENERKRREEEKERERKREEEAAKARQAVWGD